MKFELTVKNMGEDLRDIFVIVRRDGYDVDRLVKEIWTYNRDIIVGPCEIGGVEYVMMSIPSVDVDSREVR